MNILQNPQTQGNKRWWAKQYSNPRIAKYILYNMWLKTWMYGDILVNFYFHFV